ncbi:MAG: phosphatase PAP2 family protein [Deltaproteobacteria bacterium]|nr:phosphatase PAP2 family protein [Deltaproteobacteria bacterium]
MLELTRSVAERARSVAGVTAQNLAIQDAIALTFHAYIFLRISIAPDSPDATAARRMVLALLVVTASAMVLTRGEVIQNQRARALTYRLGLFVPMVFSYFEMRLLLPALQLEAMDYRLYAIDLWLLGTTPSVWMEAWNTKPIVEWLSFFYYGYFLVLIVMLIPALFLEKGRRLQELMAGALLIVATGYFLYTIVPGAGPFATLAFDEPLHGSFWWNQVQITVATAGAQLDIFPSLHTAFPAYFALYACGHRHERPFNWAWPILAFVAFNIIMATMFLRWHWFIDVAIGLLLAFAARRFSVVVAEHEGHRGEAYDMRQPVWEKL